MTTPAGEPVAEDDEDQINPELNDWHDENDSWDRGDQGELDDDSSAAKGKGKVPFESKVIKFKTSKKGGFLLRQPIISSYWYL